MAKYKIRKDVKQGSRIKGKLGGKDIDKELHKLTAKEVKAYITGASQETIERLFVLVEPKDNLKDGKETTTTSENDGI